MISEDSFFQLFCKEVQTLSAEKGLVESESALMERVVLLTLIKPAGIQLTKFKEHFDAAVKGTSDATQKAAQQAHAAGLQPCAEHLGAEGALACGEPSQGKRRHARIWSGGGGHGGLYEHP